MPIPSFRMLAVVMALVGAVACSTCCADAGFVEGDTGPVSTAENASLEAEVRRFGDFRIPAPRSPGEAVVAPTPLTWKILVILLLRTELEVPEGLPDRSAALDARDQDTIRAQHAHFEEFLRNATHGRIAAQTSYLVFPGPLTRLSAVAESSPPGTSYWPAPPDVPEDVARAVEPGVYHSVFVWAKLPACVRMRGTGVTSPGLWRGGGYSAGIFAEGRDKSPYPIIPSHEFYHQVEYWLVRDLHHPADELPSNHPPATIEVNGRALLPTWSTRFEWYAEVLGRRITPDMWREMLDSHRSRFEPADGNLAPSATPFGEAPTVRVEHPGRLHDGQLGSGAATDAAMTDPAVRHPLEGSFGLRWQTPRRLASVVAHCSWALDRPDYAARQVALESWTGDRWMEVPGTRRDGPPTILHRFDFAPIVTDAIRLRVFSAAPDARGAFYRAVCREIQVFGPTP